MSREKNLLKNIFVLGLGKVLPRFFSLFTLPIITFYLSQEEFGTYDLITTMVSFFLPLVTLQMQSAAFRFLLNNRENKDYCEIIISNILLFTFISSSVGLGVLFLFLIKVPFILRVLIVLYYFIDTYFNTVQQIARGLSKNKVYSTSVIVCTVIEFFSILLFVVYLEFSLNGLICALILSCFVASIYITMELNILKYFKYSKRSKKVILELLSYSWPLIPNSLSSWVMQLSDRVIISLFLGVSSNAVYAVANKIPNLFSLVQGTFNMAWQENASLAIDDSDSDLYYSKMFSLTFGVLVGILSFTIAATPLLFKILIKGNYQSSYNHIPILFLAAFFSSISSYIGGIYIAYKRTKEIGYTTLIAALINAFINFALIKKIGVYAASISTLISYFFLALYRMIKVRDFQKIEYDLYKFIGAIALLIMMCFICFCKILVLDIFNILIAVIISFFFNQELIKMIFKKFRGNL